MTRAQPGPKRQVGFKIPHPHCGVNHDKRGKQNKPLHYAHRSEQSMRVVLILIEETPNKRTVENPSAETPSYGMPSIISVPPSNVFPEQPRFMINVRKTTVRSVNHTTSLTSQSSQLFSTVSRTRLTYSLRLSLYRFEASTLAGDDVLGSFRRLHSTLVPEA